MSGLYGQFTCNFTCIMASHSIDQKINTQVIIGKEEVFVVLTDESGIG